MDPPFSSRCAQPGSALPTSEKASSVNLLWIKFVVVYLFPLNQEPYPMPVKRDFMEIEGKSLVVRLIIYIVFVAACFVLFLKSMSPLVLLLCLLLIISRAVMAAVVLGLKRKRRLPASQDKSK
jgi:hypothetical protein